MPVPELLLQQAPGGTWHLHVGAEALIVDAPAGNPAAARRAATDLVRVNLQQTVYWQEVDAPTSTFHAVTVPDCDPRCPIEPAGHAFLLNSGLSDESCTDMLRAKHAYNIALGRGKDEPIRPVTDN